MLLNNVLELKGNKFNQEDKSVVNFDESMNSHFPVTSNHILQLKNKLQKLIDYWNSVNKPFDGVLVSVYYNKLVAKSNRISCLFKGKNSNYSVVGAKFNDSKTKHIITYYLDIKDLEKSVDLLSKAYGVLEDGFDGIIDYVMFKDKSRMNKPNYKKYSISKSRFRGVIGDVSYIDDFDIEEANPSIKQSIVTLYNTNTDTKSLLKKLGIDVFQSRILNETTVLLDSQQLAILFDKAPYLVSMATEDLLDLSPSNFIDQYDERVYRIDPPSIEPTIGVIDTLFYEDVYFKDWVEYHDMLDPNIPRTLEDTKHGTGVTSIIVDGPRFNPWLDDGCGNFRVRHFGVTTGNKFSSFTIIKQIKEIVSNNTDIKVWNISLGSSKEINDNFISAESAILDEIQFEYDVIFVIAGTNKESIDVEKIGSPADSINGLVVNAVTKDKLATEYSRKGLALSFFTKPDVSYYGGSKEQYMTVCEHTGEAKVSGTFYAAPWIARKLSYLIDVLGMGRETAKALIIDSAREWNKSVPLSELKLYGHGVVPIKIEDIIKTSDDEIKFVVSDVNEKWNTYNYHFPVPLKDGKYPYIARATMCYFPKCSRAQGVDYTNTELNLSFGRIKDDNKIGGGINSDYQNEDVEFGEGHHILEANARKEFRKWDNVKYISDTIRDNYKPRVSYTNKNWGMEIKTNNRLNPDDGIGVRFGVVVTLKEINGVNRIDEFIKNCELQNWFVKEIDIKSRIEINEQLNDTIEFE